ncbi:hypothetical protein [Nostoc sp. DedSLP03]|uniref:hypothetical protein n=1 Tax=Nostoc sp. DedSLP03 TaxID=3075400 RepID=UPI002AD4CB6F|nr:hypothetical protein [Nostoc sp. DedSLP03]
MYNPPESWHDLFVVWIIPGVDIIEKSKRTAFLGEVEKLLQPFDDLIKTKVRNIVTIIASIPACSDLELVRQSEGWVSLLLNPTYKLKSDNLFFGSP